MTESSRIAIAGGGLAGLTLAWHLVEEGLSPSDLLVVEPQQQYRGSSNPGAIFHPFPGRSVEPVERRLRRARASARLLRSWRRDLSGAPIHEFPMVRPMTADERGTDLEDSWEGPEAYPNWIEIRRTGPSDLANLDPRLARWDDALVYRPAFCVRLDAICDRLAARLSERGVRLKIGRAVSKIGAVRDGWLCRVDAADAPNTVEVRTRHLVLAFGRTFERWFPNLAIECRGGELFVSQHSPSPELNVALNAGGHVAPRDDGRIVSGSTWWDPADRDERDDETAREAIVRECADLFPGLRRAEGSIWRGLRVGFGDYQPLAGPIPGAEQLWALGAFGGTGLFSIPLHARELARRLLDLSCDLPRLGRPDRMNASKWSPTASVVLNTRS